MKPMAGLSGALKRPLYEPAHYLGSDDRVVVFITGEGLKTLDAVRDVVSTYDIEPSVASFSETVPVAAGV